jgi:hypothetical protein
LPPCDTGYPFSGEYVTTELENRVYVTTDILQAINCAVFIEGMIYRVQPMGRLGWDDDDIAGPNYTAAAR